MADVVFMGTPDFAVPALRRLIARHNVIGVVTQPDRPAGRGKQMQVSPVKQVALDAGIPIFQPERIRRPEAVETLRQWSPDVFIVAAFGQILPQAVLDLPPHGSVNVHASLLPHWRGAAPIQAVIRAGDRETGITIMKMDAGLDTGPILSQSAIPLAPDETGRTLHDKLAELGGDLLLATLPRYLDGAILPQPQDGARATLSPRIQKEEGHVDWTQTAAQIERTVRAFTPWPGTFAFWDDQQLKILSGHVIPGSAEPGQVVRIGDGAAIGTDAQLYAPDRLQLQGRKPVTLAEFLRGYEHFIGAQLT